MRGTFGGSAHIRTPTQDPSSGTQYQDAGLVSNDGGADAVVLDGEIQIVGDVEAVGQIQKGAQVTIEGDEKPNSSAQDFPKIDFDSWDPKGNPSDPSDDRVTLVERTESVVNNAIQNPLYGFPAVLRRRSFPGRAQARRLSDLCGRKRHFRRARSGLRPHRG